MYPSGQTDRKTDNNACIAHTHTHDEDSSSSNGRNGDKRFGRHDKKGGCFQKGKERANVVTIDPPSPYRILGEIMPQGPVAKGITICEN
jgi:hypothetical protein